MLKAQYRLLKRRIVNLTKNNSGSSLWIGGLYLLTFVVILPLMCSNLCYSRYYMTGASRSEIEIKVMQMNEEYATKAKKYLSYLHLSEIRKIRDHKADRGTDLAIGIITVPRQIRAQKVEYLTQTFARLHESILQDSNTNFSKSLFVCNVHAGPGEHSEADGLDAFAHVRQKFPQNDPGAVITDRFDKEKEDYAYCIGEALKYKPKYVLMLEDDALPHPDIFLVLKNVLTDSPENDSFHGRASMRFKEWSYLKLYYPERWRGYGFEDILLVELIGLGLIGGTIFVFLGTQLTMRRTNLAKKSVQFLAGFIYLILAALLIGRPHIITWRRLSTFLYTVVPAPDCCSPAILYQAKKASQLKDYFKTFNCSATFPLDSALETFARRTKKFSKYLVEPNLVQHIGMLSSIKTWSEFPQEFLYRWI